MRNGGMTLSTTMKTTILKVPFSPPATVQHSPWQSPVPYLFGGLAAMLGLIAFALLILACSYWKLSGRVMNNREGASEGDVEAGDDEKHCDTTVKGMPVFEEKIVVIMAGDVKPTFLATPISSSRASSFGGGNGSTTSRSEKEEREKAETTTTTTIDDEKPKPDQMSHDVDHDHTTTNTANRSDDNETTPQTQNQY